MNQNKFYLALKFLWGDEWEKYTDFDEIFLDFVESRFDKIGCCVIWQRSRFFESFRRKYPNLPDIGKKQIIFNRDNDGILYASKREDYKNAFLSPL